LKRVTQYEKTVSSFISLDQAKWVIPELVSVQRLSIVRKKITFFIH
jgi:hypothetical protein